MQDFINKYINTYESLNKWVKFLLNFLWGIPTNLYRIAKSYKKNDMVGVIIGIILAIFCGCWVIAIIDIITILLYNKVYWFDFNEMQLFADGDAQPANNPSESEKKETDIEAKDADKID